MNSNENKNINQNDFILSRCNRKAAEKCFDIASKTSDNGTVLFVQGPSPSGKTHLLQAAASVYCKKHGEEPIAVSLRQMKDDFVKSIKDTDDKSFYDKYGSKKLLLIDDVQCIMGLPCTQTEFVNIFRNFAQQGVNIILFSEYNLNRYEELHTGLQDKPFFAAVNMRKADFVLRRKVLNSVLLSENIKISKKNFYNIVLNKKIEIASIKGCVSKIRLMRTVKNEGLSDKEINGILKEYER